MLIRGVPKQHQSKRELLSILNSLISCFNLQSESERAKACIGTLKNFLEPLRAVVESEQDTGQVCEYSGIELNKTLGGLLRILSRNIHGFRRYVSI